ncbi:hypothetical protein G9A89_016432 [Geosiphon pyriformis]|nr:hypothetical protein G9A89_016432 [Geosiphon pyriformis]
MSRAWLVEKLSLTKKCEMTFLREEEHAMNSIKWLDQCPHNNDEIWQMALTKIEEVMSEEIKTIKNNPSEPIELD